ncbi:bifunctional transcriptional activator/DNA repair enzyme AdaA [Streptococcus caviae]|uniref:bifunctional transcriptional activator/DNA repair enzyme AdaA n=1 Tax=Streptococcus sp. 'caviae' TaxID=1915004 RepID=UPI00094B9004|nr:trifunctional transcriptional activator/DNA repair protein Ada/methylated-DNA--[protein]-cysteine S-methyltransferase [Streptococcus sp. 'caviae']OLN84182.1 bifunctional transcriptional activator/DNA repair enzyme protein Ada [Streptococcus sp. 'caviae']
MIENEQLKGRYYKALLERDKQFDGIFFVAIKTTGIFCHATCRARKPKFENCVFYEKAEEALLAGYRPCKICQPLSFPHQLPEEVRLLVAAVEAKPEKRWREEDFKKLGIHSATARRKFKEVYDMTFVQYARARRMGLAFKNIEDGQTVIEQQLAMGYQSPSGFNDAFSHIMGNPAKKTTVKVLTASFITTPIGRMLALADEAYLYLLEFDNRRGLEREIERLRSRLNARIIHGSNTLLQQLEQELAAYFSGTFTGFTIPLHLSGSAFQRAVWDLLRKIPLGETLTYKDLALALGDVNKVRAVGNANGANQIAILIPCHRVIASDGSLGGYGGGTERKKYLLELEKKI